MTLALVIVTAVAIGLVAGLRAFTPLALVSWMAVWGWTPLVGSPFWFVGTTTGAVIMSILAVGELIGDKLPKTPARTQPAPLIARVITGAISASAICIAGGRGWLLGVFLGALGSVIGTFGGFQLRRFLVQRLRIPDLIVALAEDFVAIAGALVLVRYFFAKPI